ncbi:hypothetical protein FRC00_013410 [Tulasnella sp. 408]|nr:hypothetical protein FRC00_013410 [Tulasnella sp. 408]
MERFLATPELRYTVFTFLRSLDLLHCAQVCRNWKDDALRMRELMGQLASMEEDEGWDDDGDYVIYNRLKTSVEDFDQERWRAFLKLTDKIHVLCISTFLLHPDSVDLVKTLVAAHGGPLFPNLRRFDIWSDAKILPMISLGLVPGLTSVMMNGMDACTSDDAFEEIFSQVAESCEGIQELEIVTHCAHSGPIFSVFPELRSLSYWSGKFSAESWSSLAKCRNLADLDLFLVSLEGVAEGSLAGDLEFACIKEIRITRMEKKAALVLLGGTKMPRLQSLQFEQIEFTEEEKTDLGDRLKARCPDLKQIDFIRKA